LKVKELPCYIKTRITLVYYVSFLKAVQVECLLFSKMEESKSEWNDVLDFSELTNDFLKSILRFE
jgi:hypothetical protein